MEILVKIGDKRHSYDPAYQWDFRDGHIINIRPDGYFDKSPICRKHFAVIKTPYDYWSLRGTTEWSSTNSKVLELKKFIHPMCDGKNAWESGYIEPEKFTDYRTRDYFIDFKWMAQQGWMAQSLYDSIYDKSVEHRTIYIDRGISSYFFHEDLKTRVEKSALEIESSIGTIDAGGTFTVGDSQTYPDWSTAIADLPADIGAMTTPGNIILQGNTTEEITESTVLTISLDTDSYYIALNVHADHKHSGGAYGSGHSINLATSDYISLSEASAGTLNSVFVQDLAIDVSGSGNQGVYVGNGGDSGPAIIERNVFKGDGNSVEAVKHFYNYENAIIRNNVAYSFTGGNGIELDNRFGTTKLEVYNNTIDDCDVGFYYQNGSGNTILKNNLVLGSGTSDYSGAGDADTTEKNVSGDATSPDGATYQSWAGTANMTDYANNDYRLDATDSTLDDGDDLSAIGSPAQFSDDIEDNARSTWFIGVSEFVGTGPTEEDVAGSLPAMNGVLTRKVNYKRSVSGAI
jgi:parallel beta-helix repeat protein